MWQEELRAIFDRQAPPGALQGVAERMTSDAGEAPVLFPLLAEYLGSRADLLPVEECSRLLSTPSRALPLPADAVGRLLRSQLGPAADELVETLEPAPRSNNALFQVHGARTRSGERVLVKVIRPGCRDESERELGALRARIGGSPVELDFRRFVRSGLNLAEEAAALRLLAEDGRTLEIMTAPRVLGRLCAPDVLVTEDCLEDSTTGPCSGSETYSAWIRQAVMGRVFAPEPAACFRSRRPGAPVLMAAARLVPTSEVARRNIARYLLAMCADDPDRAADALLAQSVPRRKAAGEEEVRRRFRFSTPERESPREWLDHPSSVSHCITHWRILTRSGWEPGRELLAFLRGLTLLTLRQSAPDETDLLRDSLDEIRPHLLVFQARRILDGLQSGTGPGGIAALVRRSLKRAPLGLAVAGSAAPSLFAFGSRLLLFAAAGVLAPSLAGLAAGRGEPLAAAVVLVAGVSALAACRPSAGDRGARRILPDRLDAGNSEDVPG